MWSDLDSGSMEAIAQASYKALSGVAASVNLFMNS